MKKKNYKIICVSSEDSDQRVQSTQTHVALPSAWSPGVFATH